MIPKASLTFLHSLSYAGHLTPTTSPGLTIWASSARGSISLNRARFACVTGARDSRRLWPQVMRCATRFRGARHTPCCGASCPFTRPCCLHLPLPVRPWTSNRDAFGKLGKNLWSKNTPICLKWMHHKQRPRRMKCFGMRFGPSCRLRASIWRSLARMTSRSRILCASHGTQFLGVPCI